MIVPGIRSLLNRSTLKDDAMAGVVLGIESVPDGLASGLLAGVNPVAGLYAYLYGTFSASFFTSTTFMAVQGTGAMAIIVADVGAVHSGDDPARLLFTLSILTGVVMVIAGYLKLGSMLRFVPTAVMTGFIAAVGINIVLGQLGDFTGYDASGSNRIARTVDLILHFWKIDVATLAVGLVTVVLIVVLRRTRLSALGLVVAIMLGSILAAFLSALDHNIALVGDLADIPGGLPFITMPIVSKMPELLIPALSLVFVGLVQGAGVTAGFPNPDGSPSDVSKDFVGQGVGNVVSGLFQGMPVGGSMSASSLIVSAGAKTRFALVLASGVMAVVVLFFSGVVGYIAMPSLAGLLIVVGFETIKPREIEGVYKTGHVQAVVMTVTLVLTMVIPLQYAVLVGVGISMILYIARQSNQIVIRRRVATESGRIREEDPPDTVLPGEVVVIQPYGSLFFAASPVFEGELPAVNERSRNAVVVLRLHGRTDVGATFLNVLATYASSLSDVGSKLVIVTDSDRIIEQLRVTEVREAIGDENIYVSTEWIGETTDRAAADAAAWITDRQSGSQPPDPEEKEPS